MSCQDEKEGWQWRTRRRRGGRRRRSGSRSNDSFNCIAQVKSETRSLFSLLLRSFSRLCCWRRMRLFWLCRARAVGRGPRLRCDPSGKGPKKGTYSFVKVGKFSRLSKQISFAFPLKAPWSNPIQKFTLPRSAASGGRAFEGWPAKVSPNKRLC